METRNYKNYLYVIVYLMLLRIVINITVGVSVFSLGILFDLVLMMFWVGAIAFLMKTAVAQKIYYIIVVLFTTIFVVGDSLYYQYLGVISARNSFAGLKWLREGNTLEYDITIPLVAYLITPLLIGVIYLIIANKTKDVFRLKDFAILSSVFVVQVGLFLFWGNRSFDTEVEYFRSDAFLFETMHDRISFSEKYGYYNYHMLDLTRFRPILDEEDLYETVDEYFMGVDAHTVNDYSDRYEGYNIINIIGETLETRFIDPVLTPNLYNMKTNGLSFDNYFTTVYQQGATCNSEYMSLTGLGAITTNDWSNNICDAYSENTFTYSLPNQLEEIGYETYYFHSGYEWFYNREVMIPSYGFNNVYFQEDLIANGYPDFYDRFDTEIIYFFDEYVDYTEPFFTTILSYSGHGAYNQEEFYKHNPQVEAAYPGVDIDPEIRNYMQKLVEFDNMIGLIMDRLEENGQLDNTLFAIYPDHYPYMMDYDVYSEHIGVYDDFHEIMRQDLIIYAEGMTGEVISTPGSTMDITPTILNLVNSDANFDYFIGLDLLSMEENYIVFSDLTITDGNSFLYIDETLVGDITHLAILESALEKGITALEMQKKLLIVDYFKKKADIN